MKVIHTGFDISALGYSAASGHLSLGLPEDGGAFFSRSLDDSNIGVRMVNPEDKNHNESLHPIDDLKSPPTQKKDGKRKPKMGPGIGALYLSGEIDAVY